MPVVAALVFALSFALTMGMKEPLFFIAYLFICYAALVSSLLLQKFRRLRAPQG